MIHSKPLVEAQVLIVGEGDLVTEIVQTLQRHDVKHITVINAVCAPVDEKLCRFVQKDPLELISREDEYFKQYDLVLSANQPRAFELALSDLRWPKDPGDSDPDLPMMVVRSVANNCKMRCQYRERLVDETTTQQFVSLPMTLLPWTDEKRALVASTVQEEFQPEQNPDFRAYITAASTVVQFQESTGSWPTNQDKEKVCASMRDSMSSKEKSFLEQFCDGGLATAHETIVLLARLISLEAVKLLTGKGRTINNTNLEEVIKIVAPRV